MSVSIKVGSFGGCICKKRVSIKVGDVAIVRRDLVSREIPLWLDAVVGFNHMRVFIAVGCYCRAGFSSMRVFV